MCLGSPFTILMLPLAATKSCFASSRPHTLEIARREDGGLLDAIVITDDVD